MTTPRERSIAQAKIVIEIRGLMRTGLDACDIALRFGWRECEVWNALAYADRGVVHRIRRA